MKFKIPYISYRVSPIFLYFIFLPVKFYLYLNFGIDINDCPQIVYFPFTRATFVTVFSLLLVIICPIYKQNHLDFVYLVFKEIYLIDLFHYLIFWYYKKLVISFHIYTLSLNVFCYTNLFSKRIYYKTQILSKQKLFGLLWPLKKIWKFFYITDTMIFFKVCMFSTFQKVH